MALRCTVPLSLVLGCASTAWAVEGSAPVNEVRFGYAFAGVSYTSTTAPAATRERDGRWDHANGLHVDLFQRPRRDIGLTGAVSVVGQRSDDGDVDDRGYQALSSRVGLGVAVAPAEHVEVQVMPFAGYGMSELAYANRARDGEPGSLAYGMDLNASYSVGGFELGGGVGYAYGDGDYPFVPADQASGSAQRPGPVYSIFVGTRH
ncbi:MAG: hypothetical protein H0W72_01065 [Planctomycetes bacterium]|nr:hypothetical protein [Planctomycetota bacterium]